MGANRSKKVDYSRGRGNNLGKAKNISGTWGSFRQEFSRPTKTGETFSTYMKLSEDEQRRLKAVDGWIYRTQVEKGKRNAHSGKPSHVFSLDFDYADPAWVDRIAFGLVCFGREFFAHSTRRHTNDKPRIRIWGLFSRPVTNDEYGALSRIIAQMFDPDMTMVDKVSFRPAQMMFKPTISRDGDWFFHVNDGETFDPDAILEAFGDWRDLEKLPKCEGEKLRHKAEKAEDPTTKTGPVGDFCRAYDVIAAIEKFDLPYVPTDENSTKPRYTYTGGTTVNGAVIEDDGLFLYSHHGSDPCADMLVNAFDLVRIHKFGDKDKPDDLDQPMAKRPSWKAMLDHIADDPLYKREQAKSKYDQSAMFDDVMDDYYAEHPEEDPEIEDLVGKPGPKAHRGERVNPAGDSKGEQPPKGWFPDALELDRSGNIVQNLPNAQIIVHNDPRLWRAVAYDDFMKRVVLRRDILSKMDHVPAAPCRDRRRGDIWQDFHDYTVRSILAAPNGKGKGGYGLDKLAERDLAVAVYTVAKRNVFHPIKDYLTGTSWDGRARIDRLFIDHLGVPDTPYHREAARIVMIASVARIFEPGHKFDFAPVLQGPQGIRKSTFISTLYGEEYFGELTCRLNDTQKIAETIGGIWGMEFPELASFYRSDHNEAKQFLSAREDRVRMAYDRRVSVFPRQATFWGTTNDKKYLKDPTGNRRWLPIIVNVPMIDTTKLGRLRDQLWAEAYAAYRAMREALPFGTLPLYLQSPEAQTEASELQEEARTPLIFETWAEQITTWADQPISLQQFRSEYNLDRMPDPNEPDPDKVMVLRVAFRVEDAALGALGIDRVILNEKLSQDLAKALSHMPGWRKEGPYATRRFGHQARWRVRTDSTPRELAFGYRVVDE